MTKSFEQLLYLFGASSSGKDVSFDEKLNVEEIRDYALQQGIWPTIYNKLYNLCDVSEYANEVLSMTIKSVRQTEFTLNILKELEGIGIEVCLIKGDSVARLYNKPESRISGDTDILINPKDEKKISEFLFKKGYKVFPRKQNDHHFKAYHPIGGLLEVHVRLYGYVTEKVIFDGLYMNNEPYMEIQNGKRKYKTLGINDGLMYLTAHYIKHLVNSGGGIRQMMDLLLYIENYKKEIDFDNYFNLLKKLRYEKLIRVVMSIGAKYFGFDYEIIDDDLTNEILNDTEKGGLFGFSIDDRNGFYNAYCKKRVRGKNIKYYLFYFSKGEDSFIRILFPSKKSMNKLGYNNKILLCGWFNRFYNILFNKTTVDNEKRKSGIPARLELMKKLNMIE